MFKVEQQVVQCSHQCSGITDVHRHVVAKMNELKLCNKADVERMVKEPNSTIDLRDQHRVVNVAQPIGLKDVATKEYVDNLHTIAIDVIQKTNLIYSKGTTITSNSKTITSFFLPGLFLLNNIRIHSIVLATVPVAKANKNQIINMLIQGTTNTTKDRILVKDVSKAFQKVTFDPPLEIVEDCVVVFKTHEDSASVGDESSITLQIGT